MNLFCMLPILGCLLLLVDGYPSEQLLNNQDYYKAEQDDDSNVYIQPYTIKKSHSDKSCEHGTSKEPTTNHEPSTTESQATGTKTTTSFHPNEPNSEAPEVHADPCLKDNKTSPKTVPPTISTFFDNLTTENPQSTASPSDSGVIHVSTLRPPSPVNPTVKTITDLGTTYDGNTVPSVPSTQSITSTKSIQANVSSNEPSSHSTSGSSTISSELPAVTPVFPHSTNDYSTTPYGSFPSSSETTTATTTTSHNKLETSSTSTPGISQHTSDIRYAAATTTTKTHSIYTLENSSEQNDPSGADIPTTKSGGSTIYGPIATTQNKSLTPIVTANTTPTEMLSTNVPEITSENQKGTIIPVQSTPTQPEVSSSTTKKNVTNC